MSYRYKFDHQKYDWRKLREATDILESREEDILYIIESVRYDGLWSVCMDWFFRSKDIWRLDKKRLFFFDDKGQQVEIDRPFIHDWYKPISPLADWVDSPKQIRKHFKMTKEKILVLYKQQNQTWAGYTI